VAMHDVQTQVAMSRPVGKVADFPVCLFQFSAPLLLSDRIVSGSNSSPTPRCARLLYAVSKH
jgi:hypothetical protein